MNMNTKTSRMWNRLIALIVICLPFMAPYTSSAGNIGGNSWERHIYNKTNHSIEVSRYGSKGNVWFEQICNNSKNGPCTIPAGQTERIKYTTDVGDSTGVIWIKWGGKSCSLGHYTDGGPIKVGSCECKEVSPNDPQHGDITIR